MSDNPYYGFTSEDPLTTLYDEMKPLPEKGENEPLDSLCERKHVSIEDLVRVGARMSQTHVLAFFFPGAGIRYRDLIANRRWTSPGASFHETPRIIPGTEHDALVVVEGETDAARISGAQKKDVLITWAMDGPIPPAWVEAAQAYDTVYMAQDNDDAGNSAAIKFSRAVRNPVRWQPPEGYEDWASVEGALPDLPEPPKPLPVIAWGEELHQIEYPPVNSLLGDYLLPLDGMLLLHAWKGNYKSWLTFDLMVALATGGSWAGFETTNPELRALIVQFEVSPFYYGERLAMLRDQLRSDQKKLYHNLGTYRPGQRAVFNVKSQKHREYYLELLQKNEVNVVLFDPLRSMIGGNSVYEQETQMAAVEFFRMIMGEGIAVIATHHDSKTSARTGGGSNLDMTAGDALAGLADTIVSVGLPHGDDLETSKRRNLHWTVRNGPPISPRGFAIEEDLLTYQDEPHGVDSDEVEDAPSVD